MIMVTGGECWKVVKRYLALLLKYVGVEKGRGHERMVVKPKNKR
jgi:hypothetical protein